MGSRGETREWVAECESTMSRRKRVEAKGEGEGDRVRERGVGGET
jgi:hypothetical protein